MFDCDRCPLCSTYIRNECPLQFNPFKFMLTVGEGDVMGYSGDWNAFPPSIATSEWGQPPRKVGILLNFGIWNSNKTCFGSLELPFSHYENPFILVKSYNNKCNQCFKRQFLSLPTQILKWKIISVQTQKSTALQSWYVHQHYPLPLY